MMIPTVHLNGTSKERLIEQYCEASQSIELAYQALKQSVPNGRDFYPQGAGAIGVAMAEHVNRLQKLDDVKREIDELIMKIDEQ